MKQGIILSFIVLFLSIMTFYCGSSPTSTPDAFTVNIPINQKSVRAIAYYNSSEMIDSLVHLHVSSYYFDSTFTSNDTVYLNGIYERLDFDSSDDPISGRVVLSLTDDWVFFQYGEISGAGIDLIKPLIVDTTSLPTDLYGYFPIYPRSLNENETYSIYRPANAGDGWGYTDVYRNFIVGNNLSWNDQYGRNSGIEVFVEHTLLGLTMNFDLVIDSHGIVKSQSEFMVKDLGGNDETIQIIINRRIVDYTDPVSVNSLSYYLDEVIQKGLLDN